MQFYIVNKTGTPLSINVRQGERTIRTYHIENEHPIQIEEQLIWGTTHFHLHQSTENQGHVFWEMVRFMDVQLRYNTVGSNGNKELGKSGSHRRNELIVESLTGGGHILVGEIGIIGDGEEENA